MTRLLIVQPYVPEYRVPFFDGLRARLATVGIDVMLAAGRPQGATRLRSDDRSHDVADVLLEEGFVRLGRRGINARRLGVALRAYDPDLVIVEQAIKNLETYPVIARRRVASGPRVAMWGHGRSFSTPQSKAESAFKQWLTRQCDWFFAYTDEGAEYVADHGFASSRITVVRNTLDTTTLRDQLLEVDEGALETFRSLHGLSEGRSALFIGGLDERKGIPFLIKAAGTIEADLPGFRVLIAGAGGAVGQVRAAEAAGAPIRYLGRVEDEQKAIALRACDVLMVPRWVGLVAVDSLVAGRPIISTRHPSHSPEFGYLRDGVNALVTADDQGAYSSAVAGLLRDSTRLRELQGAAVVDSALYTIDQMIENFATGVEQWRRAA